ncbi:MAG TPA: hypothetical protein DIS98_04755 [Colwellia sp.]|nr:hypothetical protein [Colwellia sp.]
MKIINISVKAIIISRTKQYFSITFIILLANLSSACQITAPVTDITQNSVKYSQYYLGLKNLNNKQLLLEEHKQHTLMADQLKDKALSQGKLILIYSLPNPIVYQPYKAKRLLNEHLLASSTLGKENLAFTMLLRDQLNNQLHLLEKITFFEQNLIKQSNAHHKIIEQLNQQLEHVNQQLMLLKKIDQNINERG